MTTTTMVQEARMLLIKLNQQQYFKYELKLLNCANRNTKSSKTLHKESKIFQLNLLSDKK